MSATSDIEFEPLAPARRADGVFEQLRSRIFTGALAAGSKLPNERELSEALGVNRASVREALKRLEFLELIDVRHGQGSFVQPLSGSSALQLVEALMRDRSVVTTALLRQILEFRRHITCQVVELAARNRNDEHMERARELIAREERYGADPQAALEIDVAMNTLLGEATGNLMYQLLTNMFTRLIKQLGPLYYNEGRDTARSLRTHRELFAALEAGDEAAARSTLETMLGYSEEAILREASRLEADGLIGPGARSGPESAS